MPYSFDIRSYIFNIPLNQIITTREVLKFGTRSAVDQTMYRLVKANILIRLTGGIFIKAGSKIPGALRIIKAKAAAFGRKISTHGSKLAARFGLAEKKQPNPVFCISGGTSSFQSIHNKTDFIGTCDRKRHLSESFEGRKIRAFWHLGRDRFEDICQDLIKQMKPADRIRMAEQAAWMPFWMSDAFVQE